MMKRIIIGVTLFLTAGALSATLTPPPLMRGAEFFPLTLHNSWMHEVKFSGGDYHYYMTEKVIKDDLSLLNGTAYVVAEEYQPLTKRAPRAKSTVAYFRKDGFLHRYPWLDSEGEKIWDTQLGQGAEQIMPSPYQGNIAWQLEGQTAFWAIDTKQNTTATAKAWIDPVKVDVPAGTFHNCLRVETVTNSFMLGPKKQPIRLQLHFIEWYANGVGLVKAISSEGEGTPIKSVTELISYQVHR
jgi:hypothetical protein